MSRGEFGRGHGAEEAAAGGVIALTEPERAALASYGARTDGVWVTTRDGYDLLARTAVCAAPETFAAHEALDDGALVAGQWIDAQTAWLAWPEAGRVRVRLVSLDGALGRIQRWLGGIPEGARVVVPVHCYDVPGAFGPSRTEWQVATVWHRAERLDRLADPTLFREGWFRELPRWVSLEGRRWLPACAELPEVRLAPVERVRRQV